MTISSSIQNEFGKFVVIDPIDHVGAPKHTAAQAAKFKTIFDKFKQLSAENDKMVVVPMQGKHHMHFVHDDLSGDQRLSTDGGEGAV